MLRYIIHIYIIQFFKDSRDTGFLKSKGMQIWIIVIWALRRRMLGQPALEYFVLQRGFPRMEGIDYSKKLIKNWEMIPVGNMLGIFHFWPTTPFPPHMKIQSDRPLLSINWFLFCSKK